MRGQWKAALLLLLATGSLCPGQSTPQSAPTPPPQDAAPRAGTPVPGARRTLEGQAELRRLTTALGLNPDQHDKLRPIITDEGELLSAVRLNEHMTPDQKRAKLQEIRDTFNPKITAVLTPEQQEKWKKMQESSHFPAQPATIAPQKQ